MVAAVFPASQCSAFGRKVVFEVATFLRGTAEIINRYRPSNLFDFFGVQRVSLESMWHGGRWDGCRQQGGA